MQVLKQVLCFRLIRRDHHTNVGDVTPAFAPQWFRFHVVEDRGTHWAPIVGANCSRCEEQRRAVDSGEVQSKQSESP